METRRRIEDETSVENDRQKKLPKRAPSDHHQGEGSRQLLCAGLQISPCGQRPQGAGPHDCEAKPALPLVA